MPGSPDWLTADRLAGFEAFGTLAPEPNLLYTTYLDLRPADLAGTTIVGPSTVRDVVAPTLSSDEDGVLEIRDGVPVSGALSPEARAAGVTLAPWSTLLASDPAAARASVDATGGIPTDDRYGQLTRALWTDGMVLDVPAGVQLDKPILLRWTSATAGLAVFGRTFIRLGDGASASVVEEWLPGTEPRADGPQAFLAGTSEVSLGTGARLSLASIQDLDGQTIAFQHRTATIGQDASLQWALAQLGSRLVRSRVDNRLDGDRSTVEQAEIVFGGARQLFDLTSYTRHVGRDTTGNLLSKGALLDDARAFLKGMITIERSAIGTDSYLGEFGMNLSKDARSVAIPSLEIDQPDCRRAAHASSVGPIDEAQLFYLESRGIPPDEARKFIVLGFLEPVVARVPLAAAQDRLRALLEAKWDANVGSASGAHAA